MKTNLFAVSFLLITQVALAAPTCPKKLSLMVSGVKTYLADDAYAIEAMVKQGDRQTPAEYFKAVLRAANKVTEVSDTLTLKSDDYSSCLYKGKASDLRIDKDFDGNTATLSFIPVKFDSEDYSAEGKQVNLKAKLKKLSTSEVEVLKSQKLRLFVEVLVQIPLGDYGTDGFDQEIDIGSAKSLELRVL